MSNKAKNVMDNLVPGTKNAVTFGVDPEPTQIQKSTSLNSSFSDPRRVPHHQPWYQHNGNLWEAKSGEQLTSIPPKHEQASLTSLTLFTWNIDLSRCGEEIRMMSAINYLEQLLDNSPFDVPVVIFLQEMLDTDLELLKKTKWVQKSFFMTDITDDNWNDAGYGTTTLIDKRLCVSGVFRVYYKSRFGRDALFVDIRVGTEMKLLRLCNTHLESLRSNPPLRPGQVALAAQHLQADGVHAGVLGGDCNAIEPFDKTLHAEHNLRDAFLTLGGEEGQEEGFTWGYQSSEYSMKKYGPTRLDKVLFCGRVAVSKLERIGVGEKFEESKREELKEIAEGLDWITDHYGLAATLNILP